MAQKETNMFSETNAPKKSMWPRLLFTVLLLAFIAVTGLAAYLYSQNLQLKKNPQVAAQQQTQRIIDQVSRLIVLPAGEVPTIATVTDPKLLKDQPFFANSQKGDEVLIYTNARKAILYRPSANIIIDVAPVNIGNATATPAPTTLKPTPTPKATPIPTP